jgi:hypothetical protein
MRGSRDLRGRYLVIHNMKLRQKVPCARKINALWLRTRDLRDRALSIDSILSRSLAIAARPRDNLWFPICLKKNRQEQKRR